MDKTQTVLLKLLKVFDEVCAKGGISYYLADEVLLGAVSGGSFPEGCETASVMVQQSEIGALNELMAGALPEGLTWKPEEARLYDTQEDLFVGAFAVEEEGLEPYSILRFEGARLRGPAEPLRVLDAKYGFNWNLYNGDADRTAADRTGQALSGKKQESRKKYLTALVTGLEKNTGWEGRVWPQEANDALEELTEALLDPAFRSGSPAAVMSNDLCSRIFYNLIKADRIEDAEAFANMYRETDSYEEFRKVCRMIHDVKIALYSGKNEEAEALVKTLAEEYGVNEDHMLKKFRDLDYVLENRLSPEHEDKYKYLINSDDIMLSRELARKGFFSGPPITDDTIRVLELLTEFDRVCGELNIDYAAFGQASAIFRNTKFANMRSAEVLMKPGSMIKFLDHFNKTKPENRDIEYYGNNPDYPFFTMRYVDRNSISCHTGTPGIYRKNGFYIEIIPVRDRKLRKTNFNFMVEKAQRQHDRYNENVVGEKLTGFSKFAMNLLRNYLSGKSNDARDRFFRQLCREYDRGGNEAWILTRKEKFKKAPKNITKDTQRRVLFGRYYYIVANKIDKIADLYKGFSVDVGYNADIITSDSLGYEEFDSRLENKEEIIRVINSSSRLYDSLSQSLKERSVLTEKAWKEAENIFAETEKE